MGEAKRRKQLDKNFGKTQYKIWIKKSDKSGNYLVMVNDFIFDSACEKQDAEKIIDLLKEAMMNKPFPKKMDLIDLKNWTLENAINFPSFEKFTLVTATGKMERKQIHIIESIKTQMAQFGIEIKKTKY